MDPHTLTFGGALGITGWVSLSDIWYKLSYLASQTREPVKEQLLLTCFWWVHHMVFRSMARLIFLLQDNDVLEGTNPLDCCGLPPDVSKLCDFCETNSMHVITQADPEANEEEETAAAARHAPVHPLLAALGGMATALLLSVIKAQ
jgi:hypothetical protein